MGIDANADNTADYSVCVDVTGTVGWQAEAYIGNAAKLYSESVFPGISTPVVSTDVVLGGCSASPSFTAAETCDELGAFAVIGVALGDTALAAALTNPKFYLDATSSGGGLSAGLGAASMVNNCI